MYLRVSLCLIGLPEIYFSKMFLLNIFNMFKALDQELAIFFKVNDQIVHILGIVTI
jgi:hypothetical protein